MRKGLTSETRHERENRIENFREIMQKSETENLNKEILEQMI